METAVKKFSAFILCLLFVVTCALTGCATFSIDKVKYYNETLATVGKEHITRYDLLSAYTGYGENYFVTQQGMSQKKALNETLNLLIDRELLYRYALDNKDKYAITEYQFNSSIQSLFENMDSQMQSNVEIAKNIFDIDAEDEGTETQADVEKFSREDYTYEKRAEVVYENNAYVIKYLDKEAEPVEKYLSQSFIDAYVGNGSTNGLIDEIISKYFAHFKSDLQDNEKTENVEKLYNKSISLLAHDLIDYEKYLLDDNGKPFNTVTDDLIYRYFEKNFNNQIKSQYLENIREYYLQHEKLSLNELIKKYNRLYSTSFNKYNGNEASYKEKMKDISTSGDKVLHHAGTLQGDHKVLSDGTRFGYFIHTLLPFTTKQKNDITNCEKGSSDYDAVVASTSAKPRNAEGVVEEGVQANSLETILKEYETICDETDYNVRLEKFIQFMFKYTGDTGTLKAGMPYVVGTNGNSAMEQAFTDEAVRLMTEVDFEGAMSDADTSNLCITSYGIHFIFYVGDVSKFDIDNSNSVYIETENRASDLSGKYNLYTKTLNILTGETYFDKLFDEVYPASSEANNYTSNTGYSADEQMFIDESMVSHKVTKYTSKISGTKTKI